MTDFITNLATNRVDDVTPVVAADDNAIAAAVNQNAEAAIERLDLKAPSAVYTVNASAVSGPIDVTDRSLVIIEQNGNLSALDFAPPSGKHSRWSVWFHQDVTGGRTVTWDASIIPLNSYLPFINPTAGAYTVVDFESDGSVILLAHGQRVEWVTWSTAAATNVAVLAGGAPFLLDTPALIVFAQAALIAAGTTGNMGWDLNWHANCASGTPATLYAGATKPTIATGSRWSGQDLPVAANRILIPATGFAGVLTADIDSIHTTPGQGGTLQIGLLKV